jgi:hypothetical protein
MSFNRTVSLLVGGDKEVELTISLVEFDQQPDELRVTVRHNEFGPAEGEAVWRIVRRDESFTVQIATQTVVGGICLAGCFADMLSGQLADCLIRAKTRAAARDCIRRHAVLQAVSSLSCVYGCLQV